MPEEAPKIAIKNPRRHRRLIIMAVVGVLLVAAGWAFRHYYLERPMGSGPAGPAAPRAAFSGVWSERKVVLLGVGDSITHGYGASPGLSYFARLVRNPPDEFEDIKGVCLSAVLPKLEPRNMAVSASTSLEHLDHIKGMKKQPADVLGLVVMTTGGNDIIHSYGENPPKEGAMYGATLEQAGPWIAGFEKRLGEMLDLLDERFPGGCHVFLADIYDPTDGVGSAATAGLPSWPEGLAVLSAYNDVIRRACERRANVHLVPIHKAFLGHGIYFRHFWREHYRPADPYHWYYTNFEDPNDRGYDAIRRLFLIEIARVAGGLEKSPTGSESGTGRKKLVPDLKRSFATPAGSFIVGIVGDGWALEAVCKVGAFPLGKAKLPLKRTLKPVRCRFVRGPDVWKYVRPPAGPPTPPVPEAPAYSVRQVKGLEVTLVARQIKREPEGSVEVTLSGFSAGDERFAGIGPLRLRLRGPYP